MMLQSNKLVEKVESSEHFLKIFFKQDKFFNEIWSQDSC